MLEKTDRYVSASAAAAAIGVGVGLLRKWIRRGDIPAYHAGRRVVVRLADVRGRLRPYTPTTYRQGAAADAAPSRRPPTGHAAGGGLGSIRPGPGGADPDIDGANGGDAP